ncbi:MAG: hypothetical protein AAF478_10430 [Pseudomonadota bacterium]
MLSKSVKSILVVAVLATSATVSTSMAHAGGYFSFYLGHNPVQVHKPHGGNYYYGGGYNPYLYSHGGQRPRACNPRRALNKAYRMGLYNPHITRVNHKKIVVKGYSHGYPAKVVFKRHSGRCKVIKTRGLY